VVATDGYQETLDKSDIECWLIKEMNETEIIKLVACFCKPWEKPYCVDRPGRYHFHQDDQVKVFQLTLGCSLLYLKAFFTPESRSLNTFNLVMRG